MALDFNRLALGATNEPIIEPGKIFTTLNRHARFRRPTDEQGEVLSGWFDHRTRRDNTIKMNTGTGKTLVGLLELQSSLNENIGPAVYIAPDKYLVEQILLEAKELGIEATDDESDARFRSGKSIFVTNIHKLVNGLSVFGVGSQGVRIPIGAVVIDDAHACLSKVEDQFTIQVPSDHPVYTALFSLFRPALEQQSPTGVLELEDHDPRAALQVPFWAWKDKQADVVQIFHSNQQSDELKFSWPLLKEVIELCQCVFGGNGLEIAPRCIPIDVIPAFARAKRRIYMTATLADDGALVTDFEADSESVANPIKPKGAGNMGDRMILVPQEINPQITPEDVKKVVKKIAKTRNVAVIVPSTSRAEFWKDVAANILNKDNIADGIRDMKSGHVGLTVFINKYDGIDLPGKACELLVIDGLPEVYGLIERVEMAALDGTELQLLQQVQRIEQGMGRGVRSSEDNCVVLLLGNRLTQKLHPDSARRKFTPATLAQLDLGRQVTDQIRGKSASDLIPIMDYCLNANPDWQKASRTALVNAPEAPVGTVNVKIAKMREAFDMARNKQWDRAVGAAQEAVNAAMEPIEKGYLKQQLAEYKHHQDPAEAQQILFQAVVLNPQVLKPLAGINYARLGSVDNQAFEAVKYMASQYRNADDLILATNAILEDLVFDPESTNKFEAACMNLGLLLGFHSQRPEKESGKGPDNLWAVGNLKYHVIECKSGAVATAISKNDCNQLGGSMTWFENTYDNSCSAIPILIHPSRKFDGHASPMSETRIIDVERLELLKQAVRGYATAIAAGGRLDDEDMIRTQLDHFGLIPAKFIDKFTVSFETD